MRVDGFEVFERFSYFRDQLLSSVYIKYVDSSIDCEIVIDAGDWQLDEWGTVTIVIRKVSSYRLHECCSEPAQIISTGVHPVEFNGKVGVDLGGVPSQPESLEELSFSDLFILGEKMEITMSDNLRALL